MPLPGGSVKDPASDQNFRALDQDAAGLAERLNAFPAVAAGSVEVEWTEKGVASAAATVTHGLDGTPVPVATLATFAGRYCETSEAGATTFKVRAVSTTGEIEAGQKATVNWVAVLL